MSKVLLWTISEAGQELGLTRQTTSELATKLGIQFKPMINGKAKGLDAADMQVLRKAIGMTRRAQPTATAS